MTRATKEKREEREAKRERERALLTELETGHGYMFAELKEEDDRHTMHFSGSPGTGKYALVAARVLRVSMPEDSWLARWAEAQFATKGKAKKTKVAKVSRQRTTS